MSAPAVDQDTVDIDTADAYEPSDEIVWWAMREMTLPRSVARRWLIAQRAVGVVIEMDAAAEEATS